jgi:hypothetical protein
MTYSERKLLNSGEKLFGILAWTSVTSSPIASESNINPYECGDKIKNEFMLNIGYFKN